MGTPTATAPALTRDDSFWCADRGCFITDLAFYEKGHVDMFFQDGNNDDGTWMLRSNLLTVAFEMYQDSFSARLANGRLTATHRWTDRDNRKSQTETCVFKNNFGRAT